MKDLNKIILNIYFPVKLKCNRLGEFFLTILKEYIDTLTDVVQHNRHGGWQKWLTDLAEEGSEVCASSRS